MDDDDDDGGVMMGRLREHAVALRWIPRRQAVVFFVHVVSRAGRLLRDNHRFRSFLLFSFL